MQFDEDNWPNQEHVLAELEDEVLNEVRVIHLAIKDEE